MATRMTMKPCKACHKPTLHVQPGTSHVLHLLLSVVTVGAWVVIWLLMAANNASQVQCTQCGRTKGVFG